MVALPTFPAFPALAFSLLSDPLLVVLHHLRALVFVPEWPVLRRDCCPAGPAPESVAIWALVRMVPMVVVLVLAYHMPAAVVVSVGNWVIFYSGTISIALPLPLAILTSLVLGKLIIF